MIGTEVPFLVAPEVPACPGAWGTGTGDRRRRGWQRVRGAPSSPPRGICDCRGSWDAVGTRPCCWSRCRLWVRSRALVRAGAAGTGMGTTKQAACPPLLDWACKELNKLYICVVSSAKGLNLLVFHPLHSLGITQHTVKDNICAEPCVCV